MRYQESIDNDLINEDRVTNTPRPSVFYAGLENLNTRAIRPCFRNVSRYFRRLWFCISGNTKYKRIIRRRATRFGMNSRSKLDIFARIVFPVSYVLLNILYWFYFLHFQR